MFKRNPEGKYTVIITKNDIQLFTHDNLRALAISTFIDFCLSLAEQNIENEVKKIRNYAALNRIDDTKVFVELKKAMEEKISYNYERINEKRGDLILLYAGILSGVVGISFATAATMNRKFIIEKLEMGSFEYGLIATVISAVPILLSPILIDGWLNPRYKENYEKLSLILSKIDQALLIPRIPEEEIIILS